MYGLKQVRAYGAAILEVLREQPLRTPEVAAKLLLARLRHGYGPKTFFLYDLHNRPVVSWAGYFPYDNKVAPLLRVINRVDGYRRFTEDKLLATEVLQEAGVAVPPILLVIGRDVVEYPVRSGVPVLNSVVDIESYLQDPSCPDWLFSKPVGGQAGAGAIVAQRAEGFWRVDDVVLSPGAFADRLLKESDGAFGRMLQARLSNHPDIAALTGNTGLSTLRIMVARERQQVRCVCAVQKLIGQNAQTDNFSGGVSGNLVAPVDLNSGTLGKCIGRKQGNRFLVSRFPHHPFSGASVEGARLPFWDDALDVARRAARAFTHQPFLGFDLAFTDQGPMILEANSTWSWALSQAAIERGGRSMLLESLQDLDITGEELAEVHRILEQGL